MDVGDTDGIVIADEIADDEEYDENAEDIDLIRAKEAQRERPVCLANMDDIKSKFESGHSQSREERREERKQEIQNIRSRLFMGKQARIKEMYQQAVADSEQCTYTRTIYEKRDKQQHEMKRNEQMVEISVSVKFVCLFGCK